MHCQDAATGKIVVPERLEPGRRADLGLAGARRRQALLRLAVRRAPTSSPPGPKFELLAHNVIDDDKSRSNASLAVSDGQLFLRNDQYLYCIGKH